MYAVHGKNTPCTAYLFFRMDSLGLFGIIGGVSTTAKIVKAGSASIPNNQTKLVSVSSSWDYGVITGGCYNMSDVSYILLFPVFFAPGMSSVYGSCFYMSQSDERSVRMHPFITNVSSGQFTINEYSTVSYILISLS